MKKMLIPVLCLLPFVGIALWFIAGKNLGNLAVLGLILACPLGHMLFMDHDHTKKGGDDHHGKK